MKSTFISWLGLAALSAAVVPVGAADVKGPSSSQTPYLVGLNPNVSITSLITVGDAVNTKPDGVSPYRMVGIPDGLGAYDNGDGTFTVLMNHELPPAAGAVRAHGARGAFVSKWIINKNDLSVVRGEDLIQNVATWNPLLSQYNAPSKGVAIGRLCSADLPEQSAFSNGSLGFNGRLFLSGEEVGAEGRLFAHALDGTSYELPRLGKFSWENALANPSTGNKTVVIGTDDSTPGQVYLYVGDKTSVGSAVDRAGLTNGLLYGIRVSRFPNEPREAGIPNGTRFDLHPFGNVENKTGAQLQAESTANGVTEFLRPEDGHWDTKNPNIFYFVTTDRFDTVKTGTGNQIGRSRLWRLRFDDVRNPQAGGTVEMLLNGTEPHQMLDNMTADSFGQIVMQEDPGGNNYLAKIQVHTPGSGTVTAIAQHDPNRFLPGAPNFLTIDEESSGIIDISDILGRGSYLADIQAHYSVGDPELVEGGQLVVIRFAPPNEAPVAQPDTYQTAEDSSLVVPVSSGVLNNDSDPDQNAMTAEVVTQPARGTLQLNADGSFTYVPQANFNGEDSFTYRAKDAALAGQPVTVKIVVNPVNDAPTATGDTASSYNGAVIEIDVLANDSDVDGDSIAIDDVRNGRHGTTELLQNGKIRYTPETDFAGVDEFIYTLRDSNGALSTGRVQVTVVDEIAPTITFSSPANDAVTSVLNLIAGTVSNPENTSVEVAIYRISDRKYWTGRNYSSTLTTLPATIAGGKWILPSALVPSGENLKDDRYVLTAFATDRAGNKSRTQIRVWIDRNAPSVSILTPANNSTITRFPVIVGRAIDPAGGTGPKRVLLFLRRASDGQYWNGTAWGTVPTALNTVLTGQTWVRRDNLPTGENLTNSLYYLTAVAYDGADNRSTTQSTVRIVSANPGS